MYYFCACIRTNRKVFCIGVKFVLSVSIIHCAGNPVLDAAGQPIMVDEEGEEVVEGGPTEEEKKVRSLFSL